MKNNKYMLNAALAAVLFAALAVAVVLRTLIPAIVLPEMDIPNIVLLSGIALLIDQLLSKNASRCYVCIPLFALVSFALLPFAAGYAQGMELVKLAVVGCVTFTATTFLYTSIKKRVASGPSTFVTPLMSVFGLYLAAQAFMGMIL